MFRDDVGDGVRLRRLLQIPANPGALGPFEERVDRRLVVRQRPVVEIRRVVQLARHAVAVELDIEHPLRDDAPIAGTSDAGVLQGVLDGEEHARRRAVVALVDEDRAALEQVAVAFQDQVDDGVEQRMARTDESRQRLPGRGDQLVSRPSSAWHKWALLATDEISNTEPVAALLGDRTAQSVRGRGREKYAAYFQDGTLGVG